MTVERWRPVPGWHCLASDRGRVRGPSGKLLATWKERPDQLRVRVRTAADLCGPARSTIVRRLVALAWIPNPRGLPCVVPADGDADNLAADNLRWVTLAEARRLAAAWGRLPDKERVGTAKLTERAVAVARARMAAGEPAAAVARELGVCACTMYRLKAGKCWRGVFPATLTG
jgi:hypothetical protein